MSLQRFFEEGVPGCTVHPLHLGEDGRADSLFGIKICDSFFCPAHRILHSSEKSLLINAVEDWYSYSVAICDPLGFRWIYKCIIELGELLNLIFRRL